MISYDISKAKVIIITINIIVGIPKIYWFGEEGGFNILVMELLGKNIEEIFNNDFKRSFSLMTILLLVDQMVYTLKLIKIVNKIIINT
jgi:casein kinase 1